MNRKTITLILIMAIVVLAACGRDRESASDTPTAAPSAAASEASESDEEMVEASAEQETSTEEGALIDEMATEEVTTVSKQDESPLDAPDSPLAGPESPLDGPDSPLDEPPAVEPPALEAVTSAETGALVGRILLSDGNGERPVVNMKVALADVIRDEEGVARVAGYRASSSIYTGSDELGRFALSEIEPGTYTVILDAVITSIMLNDPKNGETIMVEIEPGEVVDLGRLDYESLALPGYAE